MGKRKCLSYFGDYKCHVKTSVKDSKGDFVYVDKCLKEAVENLNAVGLKTIASCCGHGIINPKITIEGLSDGNSVDLGNSNCNLAGVSGSNCKGGYLTLTDECTKYGGECSHKHCDYYR